MLRTTTISEPLALWSRRAGLFALALFGVGLVLHRLAQLTTGVFLMVSTAAMGFAALAIVCGLIAGISIWIRGRMGAGRMAVGIIAGGLLWLLPLAYLPTYLSLPAVNDITTDTTNPPRFAMLGQVRGWFLGGHVIYLS